jgi:hypothetical protein
MREIESMRWTPASIAAILKVETESSVLHAAQHLVHLAKCAGSKDQIGGNT